MKNDGDPILMDEDDLPAGGVIRWLPGIVVGSALIGFIGLAWYAYHTGAQSLNEDELVVVVADKTPVKERPLDPGGMKFPNQDKTIFETFGNAPPPKVERVMPAPEEPMPRDMDPSATKTWVNEKLQKPEEPAAKAEDPKPAKAEEKKEEKKEVIEAKPAPKAEEKPAPKLEPKPAPKAAAGGSSQVQLGAYGSEKEARAAWAGMQKKFKALADKDPRIVRADLGAKGVFHRLRVGGLSAAEAKALCSALSAKGQACLPVK